MVNNELVRDEAKRSIKNSAGLLGLNRLYTKYYRLTTNWLSTTVESPLQISSFMQNKANFLDALMNVTFLITADYENIANCKLCENKANTKPIKANSKPIKANKMPKQTQFKPNQTQFHNPFCLQRTKKNYLPMVLFPLTSGPARHYNEISSLLSICIERQMKGVGNE
ncbi:MAG TPA: hypothetical protein VMY06_13375 [Sedimentisphaerales bacterium]|nr:hypothetical protein [Sedimentisphaerales bacterium]